MVSDDKHGSVAAIASIPNLRDIGGHVTRDGARVKTGLLYRSEQLSHISDADLPAYETSGDLGFIA